MSEPQHPQPHDIDTHAGRPSAAGPAEVQPAVPVGFDSLASVGARLAQLREAKGWSVEDVSARLKVSPLKLRALEAGDLSQLPDTTFALGVVRSYAKMVGADPAPMTQALRREKGVPEPDLTMPASSGTGLPRGKPVSLSLGGAPRRRSWLWGVALAIVVLIALAMWHTNNGGDSAAWLARLKATAGSATGTDSASSAAAQGSASGAAVTGEIAGSASDAQTAGTADAASATPMPEPLPMAGATPPASAVTSNVAPAAVAPKAASTAAAKVAAASAPAASAPQAPAEGAATVALKVTQDSWFSVRQKDGKELFSGLVHAGDAKEISGEAPFKVTVGNTAGLESITLDGRPVDRAKYASAKGNVARFALP